MFLVRRPFFFFLFFFLFFFFVSRLVRFALTSGHVGGFGARNGVLTARLLGQGCRCRRLRRAFSEIYRWHFDLVSKYNVGLKTLLL